MVFLSVRGRIWLQAEAANMVESVGNYVKHRRVPVMIKHDKKYISFFVPAISGESVAHAYQTILAEELVKLGQKVCKYCQKGIFLKTTNADVYEDTIGEKPPSEPKDKREILVPIEKIERNIVGNCGVEDIGGFLYAGNPNVKRTSNFSTGYMVPVREVLDVITLEPQLHSRYALGTKYVQIQEGGAAGQMIYYVEVSSAVFGFSFDIDTKYIGKYTFHTEKYGQNVVDVNDVNQRIKGALNALKRFLIEFPVGAKRTRFNPVEQRWESLAIAVSDDIWTMPSSFVANYLENTYKKLQKISYNTKVHVYNEEGCQPDKFVVCYGTPEEAVIGSIEDALARLKLVK